MFLLIILNCALFRFDYEYFEDKVPDACYLLNRQSGLSKLINICHSHEFHDFSLFLSQSTFAKVQMNVYSYFVIDLIFFGFVCMHIIWYLLKKGHSVLAQL